MAWRGTLTFCPACWKERPTECLACLQGTAKKPRSTFPVRAVLSVLSLAGVLWLAAEILPPETKEMLRNIFNRKEHVPSVLQEEDEAWTAKDGKPSTPTMPVGIPERELVTDSPKRSVEDVGNIHLLYVTRPGTDACRGLSSQLFITREAPNERSAKLVTEVGSEMQTSFEEGLRYVRKQARDWEREFSIRLSFEDKFTSKDGGSAGTGFTIAMLAAVQRIPLDPELAVTGDVTIDGTVQPVGGVVEKLRGAIEGKCKITLIPERNARSATDLALLDGTSPLWETQVFSIGTIEQALGLARKDRARNLKMAITRFDALRARLPAVVTPNYLQSPIVKSELQEVLHLAPNHLSAWVLLHAAQNQLPRELTLNRSVSEILTISHLFVSEVLNPTESQSKASEGKGITVFPEREYLECMKGLQRLTPILDPRAVELKSCCVGYMAALRLACTYQPAELNARALGSRVYEVMQRERVNQMQVKEAVDQTRSRLLLALRKLDTDGSMVSEMNKR